MNAVIKRPCSECGELSSLRERNGYVLCVPCVCAPLDDECEAVCECGAPTARECECSDEPHEVDSDATLDLRR